MIKRAIYINISIALFLLYPSLFGIRYCYVSEKIVEQVPPLEKTLIEKIDKYEKSDLICQPVKNIKVEDNILTPIKKAHNDVQIRSNCSIFPGTGYTHGIAYYIDPVFRIDTSFTKYIKILRYKISDLQLYINSELRERKNLYCHLDDNFFEYILPPKEENETYYQKILRQRYEERYGEPLEIRKVKAQANFKNHIAKLKEYLKAIKSARLAHEPHRPMIRFIGWFWLIFEIIGMILLFSESFLVFRSWRKTKKAGTG